MIFIYSSSNSVFSNRGKNQDKLLLLNFINNYSIISYLHVIKILEIKFKFYLNINKILIKILLLFSTDFELIFSFLKKNKFFSFFYIKFFFNLFFNLLLESMINFIKREDLYFFLSLEKQNKYSLKKSENVLKLKHIYIPFITRRIEKTKKFNLPRKPFLDSKQNQFIIGEVFDFYQGSITPFYQSNFSWFASTGLKADVECRDMESKKLFLSQKELPIIFENNFKSIVFKLSNFKSKVTTKIQRKVRHLLYYQIKQFFSVKRFISESDICFNLKTNFNNIMNLFNFKTFSEKKKKNIFFSEKKYYFFSVFKYKFYGKYLKTIKKIMFFFSLLKTYLNLYSYFANLNFTFKNYSSLFYKMYITFKKITTMFFFKFKSFLIKDFPKNTKLKSLQLALKKRNSQSSILFENLFFSFNFLNKVHKFLIKKDFLVTCFDLFLISKDELFFRKKQLSEKKQELLIVTENSVKNQFWFLTYKFYFYFIYFLIDWSYNLKEILLPRANFNSFLFLNELKTPFKTLKHNWFYNKFVNLKELNLFLFSFLEQISFNIQKYISYKLFEKNTLSLDNKFFFFV